MSEITAEEFGKRLKAALAMYGVRNCELGYAMGIDPIHISEYCVGRYKPRDERIKQMCNIIGCTESFLRGETNVI